MNILIVQMKRLSCGWSGSSHLSYWSICGQEGNLSLHNDMSKHTDARMRTHKQMLTQEHSSSWPGCVWRNTQDRYRTERYRVGWKDGEQRCSVIVRVLAGYNKCDRIPEISSRIFELSLFKAVSKYAFGWASLHQQTKHRHDVIQVH